MKTIEQNGKLDIVVADGDSLSLRLNLKDENGVVVDVNNGSTIIRMGVKYDTLDETYATPVKIASLYTYDVNTQPYTISFDFIPDEISAINSKDGKTYLSTVTYYDVELYNADTGVYTFMYGTLKINRDITRG